MRRTMASSSRAAIMSWLFSSTANSGSTKTRLARNRSILHDAGKLAGGGGSHRNHEAVVAQRDVGVGDDLGQALTVHELFEPAAERVAHATDLRAHGGQLVARLIEDAAVVIERTRQRRFEHRKRRHAQRQIADRPVLGGMAAEEDADLAHRDEQRTHLDQRLAVQHEAFVRRAAQVGAHVGERAERRIAMLFEQAMALPHALDARLGEIRVGRRPQRPTGLLARLGDGEVGNPRAHAREVESLDVARPHATSL